MNPPADLRKSTEWVFVPAVKQAIKLWIQNSGSTTVYWRLQIQYPSSNSRQLMIQELFTPRDTSYFWGRVKLKRTQGNLGNWRLRQQTLARQKFIFFQLRSKSAFTQWVGRDWTERGVEVGWGGVGWAFTWGMTVTWDHRNCSDRLLKIYLLLIVHIMFTKHYSVR